MSVVLGCGLDAVEPPTEPPFDFEPYGIECRELTCTNCPETPRYGVLEASVLGEWDDRDFHLEAWDGRAKLFAENGDVYDLNVVDGRLFGTTPSGGLLADNMLRNAQLHVWQANVPIYNIVIHGARWLQLPYGSHPWHQVYDMSWYAYGKRDLGEELCNPSHWSISREDRYGMSAREVIVYERDRYDLDQITLAPSDKTWFTFGCSGRAAAKMRILGYTEAPLDAPGLPTEQRTAFFKMLHADYCANGTRYTETGIPVTFSDGGRVPYGRIPRRVESNWTAHGACLNDARMEEHGEPIWPDMIDDSCLPILCADLVGGPPTGPYDFGPSALVISAYWW